MDRVAATMPSQAHAGAAQEAPDIGQWKGQDVPLVRPSSCNVKGGIPSSPRHLPTYLRMPEFMEHVSQGCGWLVVLSVGLLLETAGDSGRAHGCEYFGGVRLVAPGAVYGPVILGPGLFVVQWGHFQGRW